MSAPGKPKKIVHPRQRHCPDCGARPGEPCVLRTGKPLREIHCTIRLTGYAVEGTWKPPQLAVPKEPNSGQNKAEDPTPPTDEGSTGVPDGVPVEHPGEVAQTGPIQHPDASLGHEPHLDAPAEQVSIKAAADVTPAESETYPHSKKTAPDANPDADANLRGQRDVFDAGSNLFQSGKGRRKKPERKKSRQENKGTQATEDEAEPSLF